MIRYCIFIPKVNKKMIIITQRNSPALWQTYLSDPVSITMEGISIINKRYMATTLTSPRLENFPKLRIWEAFDSDRHIKELIPEEAARYFNAKTPTRLNDFYAWSHKQKLSHVCRELSRGFGPDNPLDNALRLSRGEMADVASLAGPDVYLPNLNHSLVDTMPLADATSLPELD